MLCTRVFLKTVASEDLNIDDRAFVARRNAQRSVFHIRGFLAKDSTQKLLFGCQLRLAFWRNLANKNVAGIHLGTNVYDARFVELTQRTFTDIWNIS